MHKKAILKLSDLRNYIKVMITELRGILISLIVFNKEGENCFHKITIIEGDDKWHIYLYRVS